MDFASYLWPLPLILGSLAAVVAGWIVYKGPRHFVLAALVCVFGWVAILPTGIYAQAYFENPNLAGLLAITLIFLGAVLLGAMIPLFGVPARMLGGPAIVRIIAVWVSSILGAGIALAFLVQL